MGYQQELTINSAYIILDPIDLEVDYFLFFYELKSKIVLFATHNQQIKIKLMRIGVSSEVLENLRENNSEVIITLSIEPMR